MRAEALEVTFSMGGTVESALRCTAPRDLTFIETLRWEPGAGFVRLAAHLERMAHGAATLGGSFDQAAVDRALAKVGGGRRCGCG